MTMKKQSYTSLKEDLKCANDEAQGYLEQLIALQDEVARFKAARATEDYLNRVIGVLVEALEATRGK